MAKSSGTKSNAGTNHLGNKHPFQGNGKTPAPKMGRGAGGHPTAAGVVKAGRSASANMKGYSK